MLRQRVITAGVLVPALVVVVALGGPWIVALVAVLAALAAVEAFTLLAAAGYPTVPLLGVALAVASVLDAGAPDVVRYGTVLLAAAGVLAIGGVALNRTEPRDGLTAWIATLFGVAWVALLSFVVRLGHVAPPVPVGAPLVGLGAERGWIALLILGVWSYDTGAYFAGRRFGRRKFMTHISPSKTYAGLVGGLIAATMVVAAILAGLGQPPLGAVVLGPLIGFAAQAGDLAESMVKRAAAAKDSGTLVPGHGGVLDRIDSFLFAAPVLTLYVVVAYR
ncbi:MAG TPA: phosphatidate cytidylyltransferase [Candidatus Limnocylindrales bacterium]|nr:phosphatidate cytidylyltransferase [Candidatus Limnocylindrales bacterium]